MVLSQAQQFVAGSHEDSSGGLPSCSLIFRRAARSLLLQSIADGKLKALANKANKRISSNEEGGRLEFAIGFFLVEWMKL